VAVQERRVVSSTEWSPYPQRGLGRGPLKKIKFYPRAARDTHKVPAERDAKDLKASYQYSRGSSVQWLIIDDDLTQQAHGVRESGGLRGYSLTASQVVLVFDQLGFPQGVILSLNTDPPTNKEICFYDHILFCLFFSFSLSSLSVSHVICSSKTLSTASKTF
jgi:hypothetical protein